MAQKDYVVGCSMLLLEQEIRVRRSVQQVVFVHTAQDININLISCVAKNRSRHVHVF